MLIQLRNKRYGADGKLTIKRKVAKELLKLNGFEFEGKQIVIEEFRDENENISRARSNVTRTKKGILKNGNQKNCKYFIKGYCRFGDRCKYKHTDTSQKSHENNRKVKCKFFEKGWCKFQDNCKYLHVSETDDNQPTSRSEMKHFLLKGLKEGFAIIQQQLTSIQQIHHPFMPVPNHMMNIPPCPPMRVPGQ